MGTSGQNTPVETSLSMEAPTTACVVICRVLEFIISFTSAAANTHIVFMLLNIKIIPLKIILVLLNSIIMLHALNRNDPKVKQKDYSDKKNDYNAKRKYYNVKWNDYNVKRNDNNIKRHE